MGLASPYMVLVRTRRDIDRAGSSLGSFSTSLGLFTGLINPPSA